MTGHPRYTKEEIAARAKELYERVIRSKVEADNLGKYLVIDVDSGDFELDEDQFAASERANVKHPHGALYCLRIGQRSMGRIGFSPAKTPR